MTLLLTCTQVTERLTDHLEGALPARLRWRVATHLALCPGCRAFLASLRRVPGLVRAATTAPPAPLPEGARAALAGALARLGQPRPRVPAVVATALAEGHADPLLALLARTQAALLAGRGEGEAPFLPAEIREGIPPADAWSWWRAGLGGARIARVTRSLETGLELLLVTLPGGGRFPAHGHCGTEHLLVLQGGLDDGVTHAGPGTWLHYPATHPQHAPSADAEGCWALVVVEPSAVRMAGWRGWAQRLLARLGT